MNARRNTDAAAARRALRRGLLLGALAPPVAIGAAAAMTMAAVSPALGPLTGLGRWDVFPLFAGLGILLDIWLVAVPAVLVAWALVRRAARGEAAWIVAWALAASALAAGTAALATGGAGGESFLAELEGWAMIWAAGCAAAAICLRAGVALTRRWARSAEVDKQAAPD